MITDESTTVETTTETKKSLPKWVKITIAAVAGTAVVAGGIAIGRKIFKKKDSTESSTEE